MKTKITDAQFDSPTVSELGITVYQAGHNGTARMIQDLREIHGLNQTMLVRLTGYSPRSIISWAKGTKVTRPAQLKFTEIKRLLDALSRLTQNPKEVTQWLQVPNAAFEGSTPLQVIERGEMDRLWHMIYMMESGQAG